MGEQAESKLEPFLLLAKNAKGAAAAKIISDATSASGVYTFAELLKLPNIAELANDPTHSKHFALLQLFEYGTLSTYTQSPESFPSLTPAQLAKLKHLTLVSLASENRALPYATLLPALVVPDEQRLENLIIDTIYAGLLKGKMHHHEKVLHVDWIAGRSPSEADLAVVKQRLENWCQNAQTLLAALDNEIKALTYTSHVEAQHRAEYATEKDKRFIDAFSESKKPPASEKFFKPFEGRGGNAAHDMGMGAGGGDMMTGMGMGMGMGDTYGRRTRRDGRRVPEGDIAVGGKEVGGGSIDRGGRSEGEGGSPRRSKRARGASKTVHRS